MEGDGWWFFKREKWRNVELVALDGGEVQSELNIHLAHRIYVNKCLLFVLHISHCFIDENQFSSSQLK